MINYTTNGICLSYLSNLYTAQLELFILVFHVFTFTELYKLVISLHVFVQE